MSRYFTPAALGCVYLPSPETARAIDLLRETVPPLRIGALHLLEMAERLRESRSAVELWRQDRRAGYYEMTELSLGDLARRAEQLAASGSGEVTGFPPTTPLDWLHVAAALEMECAEFVDFHPGVRAAARQAGLSVLPAGADSGQSLLAPIHLTQEGNPS